MKSEVSPPLLLRRRLSVPEIVMRKYYLQQRANSEDDSYVNIFGRNFSSLSRKKGNKKENYRKMSFWKNTAVGNNKTKDNIDIPSTGIEKEKKKTTTQLNVISNVRLSQPTLDLIFREILKETRIGNLIKNSEKALNDPIPKELISNVDIGSPYGRSIIDVTPQSQTTVPRYSATPRTSSMEVNASSSANDDGSGSDTFADSLEDLSNHLSPPLPDNSVIIKSKVKPSFQAFFVPMENIAVSTPTGKISELLPAKVKEKLFARQEKRQKKQTVISSSSLPKVNKDVRPTEPITTKRFMVRPKRFGFPKKKSLPKTISENDVSKSKIPVSITQNLPKIIDGKSKKTTKIPVRQNLDSKVDRLIANILIDTLNKQDISVDQSFNNKKDCKKKTIGTSVPQGWSSFYMLHKHPESPESTSDEGTNNSRRINGNTKKISEHYNLVRKQSSPINEWSVTVGGSCVPDVEMRLRFHRTDRRRKIADQKHNLRDVRLPAMRLPPHSMKNERWSEMAGVTDMLLRSKTDETTTKMRSTKVSNRRDVLPKSRQLQPVRGLGDVLADSQLTAILRKFPGLLSVNGNGILDKLSVHHV